MKVLAINGSARKGGNTAHLINHVFSELQKEGIETELIELAGENPRGCAACFKCFSAKNGKCVITDDICNSVIEKMSKADAIILASPTYFADITPQIKAIIDRAGLVGLANGHMFKRKVGAAVVAVRRGGAIHAFDSLNHFFTIEEMVIVGSDYWNTGIGRNPGDVEKDEEGIETMKVLGRNMAWLLKKLA